ncbi:MAG TPA: hypothetical protein VIG30_05435 [Ktedonobacterales bacterium]|jgi:hypothetical protein
MTPEQEAFLVRARARLRELEGLRDDTRDTLTADDFALVERELLLRLDDIHAAITRALRSEPATLNARPATRYTIYQLNLGAGQWQRLLTTRDLTIAVTHLTELQASGEIAHIVAWLTLTDRAEQERDDPRFRPALAIVDARDHRVNL